MKVTAVRWVKREDQASSVVYSLSAQSSHAWAKALVSCLKDQDGVQMVPLQEVRADQSLGVAGKFFGAHWRVGTRQYMEANASIPEHVYLEAEHTVKAGTVYYVVRQNDLIGYFVVRV